VRPKTALDDYLIGDDRYRHGDLAGAAEAFEAALTRQPGHYWARYRLAVCQLCLQRPEPAKAALTACLDRHPDFLWAYLLRGFAHGQLDEFDAAEADYARALKLDPDSDGRYVLFANRGALRERRGRLDEAVRDLEACVALKPGQYQAYAGLAQVHERRQEYLQAVARLDQAIARKPGLASLYRWRARLRLDALNQPEAALQDLDRAIPLDTGDGPSADLARDHAERGRVLHHEHRHTEALAAYERAVSLRPGYAQAHLGRARALLPLRRYAEAEVALNRYLESGGRPLPEVYRTRAVIRAKLRKFPEAVVDYAEALKGKPDPAVYAERGWVYLASQQPQRARDDFETVIRLRPESAEGYLGRGAARVNLGQYRAGVADVEEALHHAPVTPHQRWRAARVYAQAADPSDVARRGVEGLNRVLCRQYQDRALALLGQALAALPASEREPFWRQHVQGDAALAGLRRVSCYAQLEARYAPAPKTEAPQ
jgi:tetratricopeptide (TPR) repeat protein